MFGNRKGIFKMGRTNVKPHEYYIRVLLTKAEFDQLEMLAKEQRRSKSEIVRIALDHLANKKES